MKRITALTSAFLALMTAVSAAFAPLTARADGSGQEATASIDLSFQGEGYSTVLYDNTNGLPTSEANAVLQTPDGAVWIGSYSGLIKYDGNTFERIDSTTGIASVVSLFSDSYDRLWIGTNDNGAACMDKNGEITFFRKAEGLKSLSVRSITQNKDGLIYIATTHGIATVDKDLNMSNLDESQINDEYIRILKCGIDNNIYGVTNDGDVFTISDRKVTGFYDGEKLGINDIYTISADSEKPGYVFIGTKQTSIYHGDLTNAMKDKAETQTPFEYINDIAQIGDSIWVCSDNGIGMINDGKFKVIDNIPLKSGVENVISDYQGNLWFASSKQGIMKIVSDRFTDVFEKYSLDDEVVYSTCKYGDDLYIGTQNNGLMVLSPYGVKKRVEISECVTASGEKSDDTDLIEMLSSSKVRSVIRDSQGRIWLSTFGEHCLVRYDNGRVMKFTDADGMPSQRVRTVYECSDGRFIAACTGSIAVIENDKIVDVINESDGITNTEVLTVTQAPNGDIIAGTDGDGIYVINDTKTLRLSTDSGLNSDVIMRIKKDINRDVFWIVTSNSIAFMDADYNITTVNKFPYSNNFDLYQDANDKLWVLSSNGIYVTETETMLANDEIEPVYYGSYNGLCCIPTSNSYSELTDEGDLYIAGSSGVAKINLDKPFEKVNDIKVSVAYIEADGEKIFPDDSGSFTIPSNAARVLIHPVIYNYTLMNPDVTYYLDGFDKGSTTVKRSDLTTVSYTNLKGGDYAFSISIKDPIGFEGSEVRIQIEKQMAFYEKTWFEILAVVLGVLVLAFIVILILHLRVKKYLKKQREDKLLISEIVEAFAKVIDMKDKYTNGHSSRVAEYTVMLTKELGYDEDTVEQYYNIALMHDIGKIGIPSEVLNKPGKLTDREFAIIKSHSALGYNTLKDISIMPELAIGAGSHHERPDGKGYPKGLKGDEIPRVAQIIAVADTFDAMYSDRPYRKRMNFEKVVSIMREVRGTQLQADVVDAFLRLVDKGVMRASDDTGGGTTEDIDNIRKKYDKEAASE